MAKTYKNGHSLHQLLESAPLDSLQSFLTTIEDGQAAALFAELPWGEDARESAVPSLREQLLLLSNALQPDVAVPLDRHAQRILTLAEGRGGEVLCRIADKLHHSHGQIWEEQLDAMGRSLWLYQHQADLFDEAETLFFADHYRHYGKLYDAYELDAEQPVPFEWTDAIKERLEVRLQTRLQLNGRCTISHLEVGAEDAHGDPRIQHLLIVRHGGPLSSVAEYREVDGRRGERYYRPLHEATLLYSPADGLLEVYSTSPGVRQEVAACFAEVGLGFDLSDKPLTLKQYNLSRFMASLQLHIPSIPGFDIGQAGIVEIDVRTDNPKHRTGLKVTLEDDFESVANRIYGPGHLFRHATCIAKIVIAVRYTWHGDGKTRTLNIHLSDPNRCNLRSNQDPIQRELGYALLKAWDILHTIRVLTVDDERALFPALVELYDQGHTELPGQFFQRRGLNLENLTDGGFIERRGRFPSLRVEVAGEEQEVTVRSAKKPGWLIYDDPVDGLPVEIPVARMDKYVIRAEWLEESLIKRLTSCMVRFAPVQLAEDLIFLGEMSLGEDRVPCYLARGLANPTTLQRLDIQLRAMSARGVGLILSAGRVHPLCLGANIITALPDLLATEMTEDPIDISRLASLYQQTKQLARGGMVVELVKKDAYSATLYVPGKPPLNLTSGRMIAFFQALVKAYHSGAPAVPTKTLMAAAGSDSGTPRRLFGEKLWASIDQVYVGFPPGKSRGHYQLLV
jgi:hypothetical protein